MGDIFSRLINFVKHKHQFRKNKGEYQLALVSALQDGKLTQAEIDQLDRKKETYGLTDEDIKKIKVTAYQIAYETIKSDRKITSDEEAELIKIRKYLQVEDSSLERTKKEFARFRLLAEIANGNLPTALVPNLVYQKGEIAHWQEAGALFEERVIRRGYQGGSSGFSIRIMKGVSYRVGAHRGTLVSEKGIVGVSAGYFVVTNKRLLFLGDSKSFNVRKDKVLDFRVFENGFQLNEINKQKPRIVKFSDPSRTEIVAAIVSAIFNSLE